MGSWVWVQLGLATAHSLCTKGDVLKLYLRCLFNCSSLPSLSVDFEAQAHRLPGLSWALLICRLATVV